MSKGFGRVQRAALRVLADAPAPVDLPYLTALVHGVRNPTRAQYEATRRAVARLDDAGLVVRSPITGTGYAGDNEVVLRNLRLDVRTYEALLREVTDDAGAAFFQEQLQRTTWLIDVVQARCDATMELKQRVLGLDWSSPQNTFRSSRDAMLAVHASVRAWEATRGRTAVSFTYAGAKPQQRGGA